MKLSLKIITNDAEVLPDISQGQGSDEKIEIPGPAELRFRNPHSVGRKFSQIPEIYELLLSFSGGIASSLVADWLYEKLKGKEVRLIIENEEITTINDSGSIEKVLRQKIQLKDTK